jgi:hypothetical protein
MIEILRIGKGLRGILFICSLKFCIFGQRYVFSLSISFSDFLYRFTLSS